MRIIQENISGSMFRSRILEEYFTPRHTVVADIETTGLSPRGSQVILGGLVVRDGENRLAVQYFADDPEDEAELLDRYAGMLIQYPVIVTYNGNSFDLPFIRKRMALHRLDVSGLQRCVSFDLYRILKKYSGLSAILPDLKQKTVERYLGIGQTRRDTIDGVESVRLYSQYLRSSGRNREGLLDTILLHNRDDIVKLSEIMSALRYLDLHEIMYHEGFPVFQEKNRAVIRRILAGNRGMSIEGTVSGDPEPYRGFERGTDAELSADGDFSIRIPVETVGGYSVADLKALDADLPQLQELAGYESGYLILRDPEKNIQYHEVNRLARQLTIRLLGELTFSQQLLPG